MPTLSRAARDVLDAATEIAADKRRWKKHRVLLQPNLALVLFNRFLTDCFGFDGAAQRPWTRGTPA